jgi:hypothetical protein
MLIKNNKALILDSKTTLCHFLVSFRERENVFYDEIHSTKFVSNSIELNIIA